MTLKITLLAFATAVVLGTLVAFAFVQSRLIETALFPYAVLLQVTPIVAIALLLMIWIKNPSAALVVCATIVALISALGVGLFAAMAMLSSWALKGWHESKAIDE